MARIKYKNMDLAKNSIIRRIVVASIILVFILVALPHIMYYLNFPKYSNNIPFQYQYLYEKGEKTFTNQKGTFQEIYNRGVGIQRFQVNTTGTREIIYHIDCLNREGELNLYIKNSKDKTIANLKIPPSKNITKTFSIRINGNTTLILDHKYTYGGIYIDWNTK